MAGKENFLLNNIYEKRIVSDVLGTSLDIQFRRGYNVADLRGIVKKFERDKVVLNSDEQKVIVPILIDHLFSETKREVGGFLSNENEEDMGILRGLVEEMIPNTDLPELSQGDRISLGIIDESNYSEAVRLSFKKDDSGPFIMSLLKRKKIK
ncbi:MAG: hypothetical protein WC895_01285 [Candidatus Shapirobacteria bacterium]|jgi:hypothetical protein